MIRGFSEHFTGEARKPLCSLVDYISKLRKLCQNFDRLWGKINRGTASSFEASNTCKHSRQTSKNLLNLQDIL